MKSLKDYVLESSKDSKTFDFDFTDVENGEDTVKSLKEYSDYISGDDNKITVTLTSDNIDGFDSVQDILQQSIEALRKSPKISQNETYAAKVRKLEDTLSKVNDYIDELEDDDKSGSKDDKNKDDE